MPNWLAILLCLYAYPCWAGSLALLGLPFSDNSTLFSSLTLSLEEKNVVLITRLCTAALSLLGASFIMFSMFYFKLVFRMSSRLILCLTISSIIDSIGNLLSLVVYKDLSFCLLQAVLIQFGQVASFAWVMIIAINLCLVVVYNLDTHKYEKFYHLCAWGFASFCSLLPFASPGSYGPAGLWCWFSRETGQPYRWSLFYVPLFVLFLAVIITYVLILRVIYARITGHDDRANKLKTRLIAYPIVFVLCWMFPLINRIYNLTPNPDSFFLYVMQALTAPSFGLLNAIVYGVEFEMRKLWSKECTKTDRDSMETSPNNNDAIDLESSSNEEEVSVTFQDLDTTSK